MKKLIKFNLFKNQVVKDISELINNNTINELYSFEVNDILIEALIKISKLKYKEV
jgi:hypothetical protein